MVFTFNLGQLNVDDTLDLDPTFQPALVDSVGTVFDVECALTWTSEAGKGWHNLFKFKVDGNDVDDVEATDIVYFTDPASWVGQPGPTATTGHGQGKSMMEDVLTTSIAGKTSANKLATDAESSIGEDFLRHMANEVMGGGTAGSTDIFNNEAALLAEINGLDGLAKTGSDIGGFAAQHKTTLETSQEAVAGTRNRTVTNMAATILTTILNDGDATAAGGIARIATLVNTRGNTKSDAATAMELLQAGDKLVFMITVQPKGGDGATPLGNNGISLRKYKVIVTLA
jgi:hypothetical protein